ncbi:hypothetical protein HMPREF9094_2509 [Fusobacterium animalis ATCC 51191]|uniref:Uncharacterized protein n=1 Tax=Fusobacterium animalis ATCC 51191 TaxID=997347 RepID=F9ERF4_9FUSO|nr:hypothetical protein HMPREF9094_2509 [Fusobacterium animalis ATCC 51191]
MYPIFVLLYFFTKTVVTLFLIKDTTVFIFLYALKIKNSKPFFLK